MFVRPRLVLPPNRLQAAKSGSHSRLVCALRLAGMEADAHVHWLLRRFVALGEGAPVTTKAAYEHLGVAPGAQASLFD